MCGLSCNVAKRRKEKEAKTKTAFLTGQPLWTSLWVFFSLDKAAALLPGV